MYPSVTWTRQCKAAVVAAKRQSGTLVLEQSQPEAEAEAWAKKTCTPKHDQIRSTRRAGCWRRRMKRCSCSRKTKHRALLQTLPLSCQATMVHEQSQRLLLKLLSCMFDHLRCLHRATKKERSEAPSIHSSPRSFAPKQTTHLTTAAMTRLDCFETP